MSEQKAEVIKKQFFIPQKNALELRHDVVDSLANKLTSGEKERKINVEKLIMCNQDIIPSIQRHFLPPLNQFAIDCRLACEWEE
jgi:hypothetical protein